MPTHLIMATRLISSSPPPLILSSAVHTIVELQVCRSAHQMHVGILDLQLAAEDGVDRGEDGQIQATAPRELDRYLCSGHTFHCHLTSHVFEPLSLAQLDAESAITRQRAEAGEDEIADSTESGDGLRLSAHRLAQRLQFEGRACDVRRHRVDSSTVADSLSVRAVMNICKQVSYRPMPSIMPAPIASGFLSAPPNWTPMTSCVV